MKKRTKITGIGMAMLCLFMAGCTKAPQASSIPVVVSQSQETADSSISSEVVVDYTRPYEGDVLNVSIDGIDDVISVPLNGQTKIDAYTTPAEAVTAIKWSSDNKTVAVVAADGTVTGRNNGTAIITGRIGARYVTVVAVVSSNGLSTTYSNSEYTAYSDAYEVETIKADAAVLIGTAGGSIDRGPVDEFVPDLTVSVEHGTRDAVTMKREMVAAISKLISDDGCKTIHVEVEENADGNDWQIQLQARVE